MCTQTDVENALGIPGFDWRVVANMAQPVRNALYDALYANRMSVNDLLGALRDGQRKKRFLEIILGVKSGATVDVKRLSRVIFLRKLLDVAIVQLPDMNPPANDTDWTEFTACLAGPARKHQPLLARLAPVYGWTKVVGQEKNNATQLRNFKKAFNNVSAAQLPTAMDVLAYFIQRPGGAATLKQYVTDLRMPDWVNIWRVCPPGKKPIDVSFNADKLQPHFEKHVCHTPVVGHPVEECLAWMHVFKYEDRITLDYLRTLGIRPSQQHIDIMFPTDAPRINVSTVAQDPAATKTATARRLAATDAARLCFATHYLSGSARLIDVLWREFGARYERIARDTLNACTNGFLYFEASTQKVFFVGSTAAKVGDYHFFVMARFGTDGLPKWEFSTLYMPRLADLTPTLQEFRTNGHLWDGSLS